jgi:hypothetical protein
MDFLQSFGNIGSFNPETIFKINDISDSTQSMLIHQSYNFISLILTLLILFRALG